MKKLIGIALGGLLVAACSTPTTGVVPRGDGLSSITRQGNGAWVATDDLRTQASLDAQAYCQNSGKAVKIVHSKEIQGGVFGRWPEAEILFRCE